MWGRHKKNINHNNNVNTVTFYKKLVALENNTFEMELRKLFDLFLGVMLNNGYSPRQLMNFSSCDKRSRLAFVNHYPGIFFNSIYTKRMDELVEAEEPIKKAFQNQRVPPDSYKTASSRKKCFNFMRYIATLTMAVATMLSGTVIAAELSRSKQANESDDSDHAKRMAVIIDAIVVVLAVTVFNALALGSLKYSIWNARRGKKRTDLYTFEAKALQLSALPRNANEWEAAFNRLVIAENSIREKLTLFSKKGDVEMQEHSSLIQNRV